MKKVFENNAWHHETTFEHTLLVLRQYERVINRYRFDFLNESIDNCKKAELLRVVILFHDLAKIDTINISEDGTTSFLDHERVGSDKSGAILPRMGFSKDQQLFIIAVIKNHGLPHHILGNRQTCDLQLSSLEHEIAEVFSETMLLAMVDTMGSKLGEFNREDYDWRLQKYRQVLEINSD